MEVLLPAPSTALLTLIIAEEAAGEGEHGELLVTHSVRR